MLKKKHLELLQESSTPPYALIIYEGDFGQVLTDALKKLGLKVRLIPDYSPFLSDSLETTNQKYDYIFHFGVSSQIDDLVKKHLNQGGKFLYAETEDKEIKDLEQKFNKYKLKKGIRIIKTGDISSFDQLSLTEKILATMFAKEEAKIIDISQSVKKAKIKKEYNLHRQYSSILKQPAPYIASTKTSTSDFKEVKFNKKRLGILSVVLLPIILMVLFFSWYAFSVKGTFLGIKHSLAISDIEELTKDLKRARDQISLAKKVYNFSYTFVLPLRFLSSFKEVGSLIHALDDVIESSYELSSSYKGFFNPKSSFFATTQEFKRDDLGQLIEKLRTLLGSLSYARDRLDRINLPYFPKEQYLVFLDNWQKQLNEARDVAKVMDQFLFSDSTRIYLILFQNNMEIRPTGGFIGSIGLLTVSVGKVDDFKIYDVYTVDGQLKGHVDPPEPIRRYLSQPHFFLRDSNFDPDFAASSAQAAFFLEKELGINIDGAIGINLFLTKDLLRVLGPVTLTDFNKEEIDSDNFFFKLQLFSQRDFFPGSSEKKDFLTSLFNGLLGKFEAGRKLPWFRLLSVVKKSLDEKNILLYSFDSQFQTLIETSGWGGRLVDVKCVGEFDNNNLCFPDYLSIIEANLGVNKANYFINKQVRVDKSIKSTGEIETTLTISYENKANQQIFTNSTYNNYLRVFVPSGTRLDQVFVNGGSLPASQVDIGSHQSGKTSFGFLTRVLPQTKKEVKLIYVLPTSLSRDSDYYQFFYQKQGGDKTSPLTLSFSSQDKFSLTPLNFDSHSQEEKNIQLTTDTSVDRIFVFKKIGL